MRRGVCELNRHRELPACISDSFDVKMNSQLWFLCASAKGSGDGEEQQEAERFHRVTRTVGNAKAICNIMPSLRNPIPMRVILPILLSSLVLLAGCSSSSDSSASADEPGLIGRMWESTQKLNPLNRGLKPREMKERKPLNLKSLVASVVVDPVAPKLSEQRQMSVTLRLTNKGKRIAQLEFPTTQRVEGVIRNKLGNVIERWSEDHSFEKNAGVVSINAGERVEYTMNIATREMTAGETYVVEAHLVEYETLRGSTNVTPVQ